MSHVAEQEIPDFLRAKISNFAERREELTRDEFKEASTRIEFIDQLILALGWDVNNSAGQPERFKEVVVEPVQEIEGHKRAPDYAMRIEGERKFFVEAKKPSVWLKKFKEPAFQARRYAWSAQLPIVVLTNFREIAVYDGRLRPQQDDPTTRGRVLYMTYDELESRWDEIYDLVSREAVVGGSLDRYVIESGSKGGTERIDQVFLRDLEDTRQKLLAHVAERNTQLTDGQLLRSIQLTLDRLIFLRFCEDRSMEPFGALREAVNKEDPSAALEAVYRHADARYNSGLFHFDVEAGRVNPDVLTLTLDIDAAVIRDTVERFYPPRSPYAFSVMPVEVLGKAYESFLSWRVTRAGGKVALEQKPEVRKAGGVFYTPEWLSKNTVARTLDPLLTGRTAASMQKSPIRVLDAACGSGSFLVASYRHLLDWYLVEYAADPQKYLPAPRSTATPRLRRNHKGELALTAAERKRILLSHIHGVDIDEQAVEVAKLSLLLTFMEDEEPTDAPVTLAGFKERILPDIDANVRCGNSLIGPDVLQDEELVDVDNPERTKINPFDWRRYGFQFDAIVGNPPWLMAGYEITGRSLEYLKKHYGSYVGKADLYYLFIERSTELLAEGGRIGLVVPNKMFATRAAKGLRKQLTDGDWVEEVVDFQLAKLFEGATNYTQILMLTRSKIPSPTLTYVRAAKSFTASQSWEIQRSQLDEKPWDFSSPMAHAVYERMRVGAKTLGEISTGFGNGVQTGKDPLLFLTTSQARALRLEQEYLRPIVRGKNIRNGEISDSGEVVVFPYREVGNNYTVLTPSELTHAPWLEAYLKQNEDVLRTRRWFGKSAKELTGQWWGLMFLDSPSSFKTLHLVTPSLSKAATFALAGEQLFPTGTAGVTGIRLPEDFDTRPLLAILNSPLVSTYALAHSPIYQGGFHKFSKPYIEHIPVRLPTNDQPGVWERLGGLWAARTELQLGSGRDLIDTRISDLVNEFYGVTDAELAQLIREVAPLTGDEDEELDVEELDVELIETA
jgi:hypothetical protein